MPELPEVETIVRGLSEHLLGRIILNVRVEKSLVVKEDVGTFCNHLRMKTIGKIARHGKAIYLEASSGECLRVHLGMTGQLLFLPKETPPDPYTRVVFTLDHDTLDLHYRDIRQFGRLEIAKQGENGWGPDAWTSGKEMLFESLRRKKGMMKHALLNQKVLAGLGNIYVDESLFESGIHPKKRLEKLSDARLSALCDAIKAVLKKSIDLGGTSFRNYVDTRGGRGGFKARLAVYGKAGRPCLRCGTLIRKSVVANRGTHYCVKCQKL